MLVSFPSCSKAMCSFCKWAAKAIDCFKLQLMHTSAQWSSCSYYCTCIHNYNSITPQYHPAALRAPLYVTMYSGYACALSYTQKISVWPLWAWKHASNPSGGLLRSELPLTVFPNATLLSSMVKLSASECLSEVRVPPEARLSPQPVKGWNCWNGLSTPAQTQQS